MQNSELLIRALAHPLNLSVVETTNKRMSSQIK